MKASPPNGNENQFAEDKWKKRIWEGTVSIMKELERILKSKNEWISLLEICSNSFGKKQNTTTRKNHLVAQVAQFKNLESY